MKGNERKGGKKEARKARRKEQMNDTWVLKAQVVFTAAFLRCERKDAAQSIWKGVMTVMMCFSFSWQEGGHRMGPLGFSRQPCHCGLGWWQAWQSTVGNSAYVGWGGNTSKLRRGLPPQPREHKMKHHNSQEPLYDGVLWSTLCQMQMSKIFENDIRRQ